MLRLILLASVFFHSSSGAQEILVDQFSGDANWPKLVVHGLVHEDQILCASVQADGVLDSFNASIHTLSLEGDVLQSFTVPPAEYDAQIDPGRGQCMATLPDGDVCYAYNHSTLEGRWRSLMKLNPETQTVDWISHLPLPLFQSGYDGLLVDGTELITWGSKGIDLNGNGYADTSDLLVERFSQDGELLASNTFQLVEDQTYLRPMDACLNPDGSLVIVGKTFQNGPLFTAHVSPIGEVLDIQILNNQTNGIFPVVLPFTEDHCLFASYESTSLDDGSPASLLGLTTFDLETHLFEAFSQLENSLPPSEVAEMVWSDQARIAWRLEVDNGDLDPVTTHTVQQFCLDGTMDFDVLLSPNSNDFEGLEGVRHVALLPSSTDELYCLSTLFWTDEFEPHSLHLAGILDTTPEIPVCETSAHLYEIPQQEFNAFPQPAFDQIYLDANLPDGNVSIGTLSGSEVLRAAYHPDTGIPCSSLAPGMYVLTWSNGKRSMRTRVVIG